MGLLLKSETLLKVTLVHGCFSGFSDCTNGTNPSKHHIYTTTLQFHQRFNFIQQGRIKLVVIGAMTT